MREGLAAREAYELYPLGESAAVVRWPGGAGERSLQLLDLTEERLKAAAPPWVTEWVRAYTSLTVFYDPWLVYAEMQRSGGPKAWRGDVHGAGALELGVVPRGGREDGDARKEAGADLGQGEGVSDADELSVSESGNQREEGRQDGENEGTPYAWVCAWIRDALCGLDLAEGVFARKAKTVLIPALFGGDAGPDLRQVAERAGLAPEEAIRLYCSGVYTVHLIGFLPGFPYLGGLPSALAAPRLAEPRAVVPAGSIGIAGLQSGIYPVESPGGWQLIGRTPLRLFDAERAPASLLQPGDCVRFEAVTEQEYGELVREAAEGRRRLEQTEGEEGTRL
ncbi:5-oxoprolinase subunit PxpB [Paenibacillus sp. S-38]|uniref:5-oxoprolinase subunit PxpB n=1 Tax=Paenibacillus sp. S-38 TaxID=3416710 RepID=UPI003CF5CE77